MEKYYDLKCLLKNTKDEKLKIFIYRNSYNELGLSTLCVEKDNEIERLKEQLNDEIDDELKQSEIMVKKQEEIERLKDDNKYLNKVNIELSSEKNILKSIIKDAKIKLFELNYKLKEIHNIPFDISEIFEIIDLLDKVEK